MELDWLAIAAGGALGAVLRAMLIRWVGARSASSPVAALHFGPATATLLANTLGCLLIGLWLGGFVRWPAGTGSVWVELFVVSGVCGGLTTFSTLCADAVTLGRERGRSATTVYLLITLIAGATAFNFWLGRIG